MGKERSFYKVRKPVHRVPPRGKSKERMWGGLNSNSFDQRKLFARRVENKEEKKIFQKRWTSAS